MDEIVYKTELKGIICQFIKTGEGYVRQQVFPGGIIHESDYTEEEYQKFLNQVKVFNQALEDQKHLDTKGNKKTL